MVAVNIALKQCEGETGEKSNIIVANKIPGSFMIHVLALFHL